MWLVRGLGSVNSDKGVHGVEARVWVWIMQLGCSNDEVLCRIYQLFIVGTMHCLLVGAMYIP